MRQSAKSLIVLALGTTAVAVLLWTVVRDTASQPYSVGRSGLSGWTVVASRGAEPWIIAARPPSVLAQALFQQLSAKAAVPLVAPDQAVLPLVLRSEYDDALQGVYGVDSLLRMAHDAGIETAVFEPVCVAHRAGSGSLQPGELFYVAFTSPEFLDLRERMLPAQPEHGGTGVYDPRALVPILPVAATDGDFGRWWPIVFDRRTDCRAPVFVN